MLKNLFFNSRKRGLKIKNYGKKRIRIAHYYVVILLHRIIVLKINLYTYNIVFQ